MKAVVKCVDMLLINFITELSLSRLTPALDSSVNNFKCQKSVHQNTCEYK